MGTVYTLPNLPTVTEVSRYSGTYSGMPSSYRSMADDILNNGFKFFSGDVYGGAREDLYFAVSSNNYRIAFYEIDTTTHSGYCKYGFAYHATSGYYIAQNFATSYDGITIATEATTEEFGLKAAGVYRKISDYIIDFYNSEEEAKSAIGWYNTYPITYSYTNSIVLGPSEATVGSTVVVSAIPDTGYGITDTTSQIIVTNNDIAVPYTWDASTQQISFTMPDPS